MPLVNTILNLAALLLWIAGWSARFDPLAERRASTLAGTLRRAGTSRAKGWTAWAVLASLLLVRAVFGWLTGPALGWTPRVDLTATVLPFRGDYLDQMLLFSLLSFGNWLAAFYVWLWFLGAINRRATETNPFQRFVRQCLGRVGRWPGWVSGLLQVALTLALWCALRPVLARIHAVPPAPFGVVWLLQGACLWVAWLRSVTYLVAALLVAHLANSYVYLGAHPCWEFVNGTTGRLLRPLRSLPLRAGRVDFAPVAGLALVFLLHQLLGAALGRFFPS